MKLILLFFTFFKIGLFTFGGGYAMLPLIDNQVIHNNWLSSEKLIDFVAISESTPGPFAVNISTYVGVEVTGLSGAFAATTGVVLPSFLIILLIANSYEKFKNSRLVKGLMRGLKPAVVGMICSAVVSVGKTVFFPTDYTLMSSLSNDFIFAGMIFVIMLVLAIKKIHPILIILLSAFMGILLHL